MIFCYKDGFVTTIRRRLEFFNPDVYRAYPVSLIVLTSSFFCFEKLEKYENFYETKCKRDNSFHDSKTSRN